MGNTVRAGGVQPATGKARVREGAVTAGASTKRKRPQETLSGITRTPNGKHQAANRRLHTRWAGFDTRNGGRPVAVRLKCPPGTRSTPSPPTGLRTARTANLDGDGLGTFSLWAGSCCRTATFTVVDHLRTEPSQTRRSEPRRVSNSAELFAATRQASAESSAVLLSRIVADGGCEV